MKTSMMLLILALQSSLTCFKVSSPKTIHFSKRELKEINKTLQNDEFFGGMEQVGILRSDDYGVVFHMKKPLENGDEKHYEVKIGFDRFLTDFQGDVTFEDLQVYEAHINDVARNARWTGFLRQREVPLISNVITYRHLIMQNPSPKKTSISIKYVEASEMRTLGSLTDLIKRINSDSTTYTTERKLNIVKDLFYKLVLSLKGFNELNIIHGDLCIENIFLDQFDGLGENYLPYIANWYKGFLIEHEKHPTPLLKYKKHLRPAEMVYFQKSKQLVETGPLGYKFSGKEDLYALAVLIVEFSKKIKVKLNDESELIEIIEGMVYPLSFKQIKKLASRQPKKRKKMHKKLKQYMKAHLDHEYITNSESLHELSKDLFEVMMENKKRLREGWYDHLLELFDQYQPQVRGEQIKYFELLMEFFTTFIKQKKEMSEFLAYITVHSELRNGTVDSFFALFDHMKLQNAFQRVIDERFNHDQILERLYHMINRKNYTRDIVLGIAVDQHQVSTLIYEKEDFTDINKSYLYVLPSFYNLHLRDIRMAIFRFNQLRVNNSNDFGDPIEMPDDKTELYPVNDFCGQVWIKTDR